jgi:hypothetical protein
MSVTAGPGGTAQSTLTLTSALDASPNSYTTILNVSDPLNVAHSSTASAAYTVTALCTLNPPAVAASPAGQQTNPGATVSYDLTVTNRDSSTCPPTTFGVQFTLPAGWVGALSSPYATVAPGQNATLRLSVSSAGAAIPGTYEL